MALAIDQREREGILILALVGSLTMGREDTAFRTAVQSYIAAGRINIILDCSRLGNIDSAGVGALVFFHVALRLAGGRVVLLNMAQTQMDLLVSAKLRVLFDVFLDQQDVVNSFFPDRASTGGMFSNSSGSKTPNRILAPAKLRTPVHPTTNQPKFNCPFGAARRTLWLICGNSKASLSRRQTRRAKFCAGF